MLNRRLQVMLDDERMERLEQRSAETGASVGEVVRRAIDAELPPLRADARAALARFLESPAAPVDHWDEMKRQLLEERRDARQL